MLEFEHIDFYGFCGRGAEKFPNGLLGKPVLSPEELIAHGDEYYVVPAVVMRKSYREITQFLRKHKYPKNHVLDWIDQDSFLDVRQYFDFPALYRRGTAFIDGCCYDCETSYRFAEWCGGAYSSIIAFEPDPDNYAKCCKRVQDAPLANIQLINAGLSSLEGTAVLDVQNTILRDKPLLAISVYHLQGDVFAVMDYLHQLLPEYRFLLRHYTVSMNETILYASVDL